MKTNDYASNVPLELKTIMSLLQRILFLNMNLLFVYFLEYSIITAFAKGMQERIILKYPNEYENGDLLVHNFNDILQFSYQLGVFISRSSLSFIQIRRVWTLTAIQALNFVIMFLNAKYFFCDNIVILSLLTTFIGLMGGASYVNVMHGIR